MRRRGAGPSTLFEPGENEVSQADQMVQKVGTRRALRTVLRYAFELGTCQR
jgi:hypothetical protein